MSECKIEWEKFKNLVLNYIASVLTLKIYNLFKSSYDITPEKLLPVVRNKLDKLNEENKKRIKEFFENEKINETTKKIIEGIFLIGEFKKFNEIENIFLERRFD